MDKEKKLQKLNSILQEWLQYSIFWNEVEVTTSIKTKVDKVKYETRRDKYGVDYKYTEQWVEKIPPTEFVKIRYFNPKTDKFCRTDYESIEFPYSDMDRRIEHYENKVRNLKSKSE